MNTFDLKNVLSENSNVSTLESFTFSDFSCYNMSLDFLAESKKEFNEYTKELYASILESEGNEEIITESFDKYFRAITKFIDKFIKFVKNLVSNFFTSLSKLAGNDEYINEKAMEILNDFTKDDEFSIYGYTYTFKSTIPAIHALEAFNKDFINIDFSNMKGCTNSREKADKIIAKLDAQYNEFSYALQSDWYDIFRGKTILHKEPITADKFPVELFRAYRSGKEEAATTKIHVDKKYAIKAYNEFKDYDSSKKDCINTQNEITKEYDAIKKKIDNMVKRHYDKDLTKLSVDFFGPGDITMTNIDMTKEIMNKIDIFIKAKSNQVQQMSSIHLLAFSAKLDALKEQFMQNKKVLYISLRRAKSNIKVPYEAEDQFKTKYECDNFLYSENIKNADIMLESFLKEYKVLKEAELESLNEVTLKSVRERIDKIIEFIKNIWQKFLNKSTEILATDRQYLEKYKDTILRKEAKPAKLVMPNYPQGVLNIVATDMPLFNYHNKQLTDKMVDQVTFATYITNGKNYKAYDGKEDLSTYFKNVFRGSSNDIEFASTSLNMTDLYNYCYNYKNMVEQLRKDSTTLENSARNAKSWVQSIVPAGAEVKESAIVEKVEINKGEDANQGSSTNDDKNIAAKQMNNISKDSEAGNEKDTKATVGVDKDSINEANSKIDVYLNVCTKLFGSKLTAAEEIYKGYMQIIRSHVSDYVGDKSKGKKDPAEPTDYSQLSADEKKTVEDVFGKNASKLGEDQAKSIANKAKAGANSTVKDKINRAYKLLSTSMLSTWAKSRKK